MEEEEKEEEKEEEVEEKGGEKSQQLAVVGVRYELWADIASPA